MQSTVSVVTRSKTFCRSVSKSSHSMLSVSALLAGAKKVSTPKVDMAKEVSLKKYVLF